ncbi:uncharacterized protein LOC134016152 [Osmerus eperlanus]|uniref:uncharacterized protein LOC134016152 n=1 Tax=Osmerus eperlanus TaxID=29151 RepID=UPI002E0E3413
MDVESLKNSARPRVRCLDVFLVVSVISLFLAVVAVAGLGTMAISELRLSVKSRSSVNVQPSWLTEAGSQARLNSDSGSTVYKMQNFAYLRASTSEPQNSTLALSPVAYGSGSSVGSIYDYNTAQNILRLTRSSSYFLYLDLHLTCTARCPRGHLTVTVGEHLTCRVELPEWAESTPITRKCWVVTQMEADSRLVAQMTVPEQGAKLWRLDENHSGLGIFLVD